MSFVEGNLQLGIELQPGTLDKLKQQIAQLEKGAAIKLNINQAPIDHANRAVQDLERNSQRAGRNISQNLGGAIKAAGVAAGALGAIGAASLATMAVKAINAGKEFNILQQQVRAGLTAVLGTTAAAEGLLQKVNALNDTSPFPRSSFLAATQQLVGFGVQADKVTGILDAVQQAVAGIGGDSNDIAMFTRSFAQIQSQGRLTGDVLFSMGSKGVDAAAIIGKQIGKTGQQIKDEVSKGAIGADQAIDLLTKGLQEKFKGATDNVAKSFLGAKDRVTARLRDIGAAMTSAFIDPKGGGAAVDAMNNVAVALANIRDKVIKPMLPLFQQMGVFLVQLSQKFLQFTSTLKIENIMKLLETFKALAPAILLAGGALATNLTSHMPLIGRLVGALGGPIAAIALLIATTPQLRAAFMDLVTAIQPLVEAILPALQQAIQTAGGALAAMLPILNVAVTLVGVLSSLLTPLVNGLTSIGLAGPIIALLVLRFTALKTLFTTLSASGASTFGALRGSLASLITPTNFFIAAIGIVINRLATMNAHANRAADALEASIMKGLDVEKPEDLDLGLGLVGKELDIVTAKLDKLQKNTVGNVLGDAFDPTGGFGVFGATKQQQEIADLRKEKERLFKMDADMAASATIRDNIIEQSMKKAGRSAADVGEVIKTLGIRLTDLDGSKVEGTVEKIVTALAQIPVEVDLGILAKLTTALQPIVDGLDKITAAQDKVRSSTRSWEDAVKSLQALQRVTAQELQDKVVTAQLSLESAQIKGARAADRMTQAQMALTQAQRGLVSATEAVGKAQEAVTKAQEKLAELEKTRARLLADVNNETRELSRANAALAASQKSLVDLAQQEQALRREAEDLADESGDKIAAADRGIERAKIALNNARREEIALQEELNRQNMVTFDMTGMGLDEIKSRLAGAKASLAAQKAIEKSKGKEEENADKLETAELNRVDAEYALKQAIEARGDVEADLAIAKRENEEALNEVIIDREEINRRIEEQHIDLNILLEGETTKARTLKGLDEEIKTATENVTTAVRGVDTALDDVITASITVRDRQDDIKLAVIAAKDEVINLRNEQRNVRDAARETKEHTQAVTRAIEDVKAAREQVTKDTIAAKEAVAIEKNDQEAINRLLWDRIGLNSTLLKQNPEIAKKLAEQIVAMLPAPQDESTAAGRDTGRILSDLINAIMNKPQDVIGMMKNLGIIPLAEGAIVRQHTVAQIGEYGKAEVVLPLTKPARAMTLLAKSIPLMHTSLQKKIAPLVAPQSSGLSIPPAVSNAVTSLNKGLTSGSGKPVVRRADGPVTYGQMQELITLMNNIKSETHIEAPISVTASYDEDELMRKLTKKLERHINYLLDKRR